MLVKKTSTKEIKYSFDCTMQEYNYPSNLSSVATAFINGRFPIEKRAVNLECEEVYYILAGSGIIHSEKGEFEINEGDLYFFEKGEIYWVEGNKLSLILINTPKWTDKQQKIVE